jgi:hypothetical protein
MMIISFVNMVLAVFKLVDLPLVNVAAKKAARNKLENLVSNSLVSNICIMHKAKCSQAAGMP